MKFRVTSPVVQWYILVIMDATFILETFGLWSPLLLGRMDASPSILNNTKTSYDVDSPCPVYTNEDEFLTGIVTSPGYPNRYKSNTRCFALLEAPLGYYFDLTIEDIIIEYDEMCFFDYIAVKDGSTLDSPTLALLCGRYSLDYSIKSTSNAIFIHFVSDGFLEFRGFKIHYQALHYDIPDETEVIKENEPEDVEELENVEDDEEDDKFASDIAEWINGYSSANSSLPVSTSAHFIIKHPQNATVVEGNSHILDCHVNVTNPSIVWLKDNMVLHEFETGNSRYLILPNNSLFIPYMSELTEGIYTCVILSEYAAVSLNAWITLDIHNVNDNGCTLELYHKPKDAFIPLGQNASMKCEPNLNATIAWLKDGDSIENFDEYGERIEQFDNELIINAVELNDSGIYTCLAVDDSDGCIKVAEAELRVYRQENLTEFCGQIWVQETEEPEKEFARVVAGHSTIKGAFPWQTMLWEKWAGSFCGGTLLNERWVVTAAHCFSEFEQRYFRTITAKQLVVKLGKHDQLKVEPEEQVRYASEIIVHPDFNTSTYDNDIALIKLSDDITFTKYVRPICLLNMDHLKEMLYSTPNLFGTVTGWGMIMEGGATPATLQAVNIPFVPWKTCRASTKYVVTTNMFCAGYYEKVMGDACHGDSGGPFMISYEERWYLVGIVSWGEGCDRQGKYGFYTNVANYFDWITQILIDAST